MVRPLRIEFPDAWYHVTSRGNEQCNIFRDDRDRKRFLRVLVESSKLFNVEVHCYVLMSNHFHLLLKTLEANLSRFMQRFNTAYTIYFNIRHQRAGHLYQGRYKAILVEADEYLLELSRYIHLNPVRVKKYRDIPFEEKVRILRNYAWSSLPGYIMIKERNDFMRYAEVLGYMGGDNRKGRTRYRDFILYGLREALENPLKGAKANAVLGSDPFLMWVNDTFISEQTLNPRDFTHLKTLKKAVPIEEIARAVAREYGVKMEDIIMSRSRFREARQVLLEVSHRLNLRRQSLCEMGEKLGGISGEAISKTHKQMQVNLEQNKKLSRRINRIIRSLIS